MESGLRDRKGDQRGVNRSRFKILANSSSGLIPKCTPNPRILCTVWSSYEGATPSRKSLRNQGELMRKQAEKKLCKRQQGIYHRLIRRTTDEYVGLTDDTEPAAKKNSHRLNRCPGLNSVGSTGDRAPDDPTKSNTNVGAVVQRDYKTDKPSTG